MMTAAFIGIALLLVAGAGLLLALACILFDMGEQLDWIVAKLRDDPLQHDPEPDRIPIDFAAIARARHQRTSAIVPSQTRIPFAGDVA